MDIKLLESILKEQQIAAPAIYDCISARAVELVGYKATYLSSTALAYSFCGISDMGIISGDEICYAASRISDYSPLPLIVDVENAFSNNPVSVRRLISRLVKAGADAIVLDDTTDDRSMKIQTGVEIVSREQWNQKVKEAVSIAAGTKCMVIARTFAKTGFGIEEAIERCNAAKASGADITCIYGLKTMVEAKQVAALVKGLKMWSDFGLTDGKPDVELQEIEKLGYKLITIHYTEKATLFGMTDFAKHNKQDGNTLYHDEHDFDGLLRERDHHTLFNFHKYWLPMEEQFNNVDAFCNSHSYGKKAKE